MAGTSSWSSSCSCTSSLGSLDDDDVLVCAVKPPEQQQQQDAAIAPGAVKFLCSYGGRILPRHSDGALRYVGGDNRVVSLHRPLRFSELERKLREMCGWGEAMALRCQLPTEDLDALVSVTGDGDLGHLLEEYDTASRDRMQPLKIRAFLFARATPPLFPSSTVSSSSPRPTPTHTQHQHFHRPALHQLLHHYHHGTTTGASTTAPITAIASTSNQRP